MSRIQSTATVTVWGVVCSVLVGCGDVPRSVSSTQVSSRDQDTKVELADRDAKPSAPYVNCRATFTAFEKNYPWFDDSSVGHDDGIAPLASFVLSEPAAHADRAIGILFKDSPNTAAISLPGQDDIGSEFTFQIPKDFLAGTHKTIDNSSVSQLRRVEP